MKRFLKKLIVTILTFEARLVLRRHKPYIIAVTGSVGKTSTKDAIATALSAGFSVRKSAKSFNSDIGVPLTILGCPNAWSSLFGWMSNILQGLRAVFSKSYPPWLVLEIGADRPGDIAAIAFWLRPDIVVVTRLAEVPVHIEFFESREALIAEKRTLARALKDDGLLVLNSDDSDVLAFQEEVRSQKVVTYGFLAGASVRASQEKILLKKGVRGVPDGARATLSRDAERITTELYGALGRQHIYPLLAAYAVGREVGISVKELSAALKRHATPPGRMRILEGIKKTTIIDDSYNSSPIAVHEAFSALKELHPAGRRIVVLGDMLELGKYSAEAHREVGREAAVVADLLFSVGFRARDIAAGALIAGMTEKLIIQLDTAQEAGQYLQNIIEKGDLIFIKGSQSMRMERAVEEIMAHPERAEELLVRQESEWRKRP